MYVEIHEWRSVDINRCSMCSKACRTQAFSSTCFGTYRNTFSWEWVILSVCLFTWICDISFLNLSPKNRGWLCTNMIYYIDVFMEIEDCEGFYLTCDQIQYRCASLNDGDAFLRNALGDFVVVCTCTYTKLDSVAYYTPKLYGIAQRFPTCAPRALPRGSAAAPGK